ncbi:MAG: STAS domain-containing protein [Proteobacteria bacterium]|nr:STAS domain-containing protein [Pseudomonadota bacterium]
MKIEDRKLDDFVVLSVDGNIVLEDTVKLKEAVERHIEDSDLMGIIINCDDVKFIDSSGLGLLVSIYKTLIKRDKKFALTSLNNKTMEIFVLTKLDKILTIAETDQDALDKMK